MKDVDIVLASYNGENFIEEQINSILNQTYEKFNLYISDDLSNDHTLMKIKKFKDDRIKIVNIERQGGVVKNFEKALSFSRGDYIFLSDQDDFWLPNKLKSMINILENKEKELGKDIPIMLFSDLTLVDKDLQLISDSFYGLNQISPDDNLNIDILLWMSSVFGCSCAFNRSLLNCALPFPLNICMHDHWLALVSLKSNGLFFLDKSFVLYRQHDNNVIGGNRFKKNFFKKILTFLKLFKGIRRAAISSIVFQKEMCINYNLFYFLSKKVILNNKGRKVYSLFFSAFFFYFYMKSFFINFFRGEEKDG